MNIITSGKKPHSISERNVYLTLIAEEIRSYGTGYNLSEYNLPIKLAVGYLKFNDMYLFILNTCLRKFKSMKLKEFTEGYENEIVRIYELQRRNAIDKAVEYIREKVGSKEKVLTFKLSDIYDDNEKDKVDGRIITLLKKRAITKMRDDPSLTNIEEANIQIRKLPKTTIDSLEVKIVGIAKKSSMITAMKMAKKRAIFDRSAKEEEKKKYRFKELKPCIKEVFRDLLINSSDRKFKNSKINRKDAVIIQEAADNYEVVGNPTYLHNERVYKKALGQYIRPILKKVRKRLGK